MHRNFNLLLFFFFILTGCADENFYHKDALFQKEKDKAGTVAPDSVWVKAGRHYNRGSIFRFFWGDHNRELWDTPVKVPVFKLNEAAGGLKVLKSGGGYQTTSFQLTDSAGVLYAFRSVDKDPVHVLSKFWQKTFVANIVRDQTSSSNPFGMLLVPPLAEAVGVHHTNPRLFYVPANDTTFGAYAPKVKGQLFMLEEKYKAPPDITSDFTKATDFISSDDALRLRYASNKYRFNQKAFARARLLDLLMSDWDRHKGQWDWAVLHQKGDTIFEPIPKDRDQVFLKMNDGLIPSIATSKLLARKFQSFDEKIKDVKGLMINAKFIDERLLHRLSAEDWQAIARDMQNKLTDSVIAHAVKQLPPPVHKLQGDEISRHLKSRRAQLPEAAAKMYAILAKEVTIPGTDEEELFLVKRLNDEQTLVQVVRLKTKETIYSRLFNRSETERIILHGLRGDDKFLVEGHVNKSIPVDIYGGMGEDKIKDKSRVNNWRKMTNIYDTERGNEIDFGTEARDRTTRDVKVHVYDQEGN